MKTDNQELQQEESIQDTIRAAMDEHADEPTTVDAVDAVDAEETVSDRDENGRFKAKTPRAETPQDTTSIEEVDADKPTWDPSRPPSSWKPKAREKWGSLDPEIREEITRREENAAMGIRKLQEQRAPVDRFLSDLAPHMQDIARSGANPNQHLFDLLETERGLRSGDMPMKFNALLAMADKYAIPLRDIINASVGQEILSKPQQSVGSAVPQEIRKELDEIRSWREQQEQGMVDMQVQAFGADKEFFNDVRDLMADFIETGRAKSLDEAYDMAVWASPDVRDLMISRKSAPANPVVQRQAKAVGAGVRPSGAVQVSLEDEDAEESIADTVRKAMRKAESSRV